jgi:thiol-disulfide isomerase/thioredoxin
MRPIGLLFTISVSALFAAGSVPAQEKKIDMTTVKYDGLKQEILKHRGKVVLVDFWATYCIPCKAAMPHYVELQQKYGDKGLVIITVSVDPADNPKKIESANKFLNESKITLRNLILDEPVDVWTKRFEASGVPFSYIFDRQGKWVRYRSIDMKDYDQAVEKTLLQFLGEK